MEKKSLRALSSCARISDEKGSVWFENTTQTLQAPVVEYMHVYCMNSEVAITVHHPWTLVPVSEM
jgi:hypothetical protein